MLADRYYQLLTAYVDGELSARQRKAVLRLLRRSPEARVLFRQLQADAAGVRHLPRQRPGDHFPLRVMRAVAERGLQPARAAGTARPRGAFPWFRWAAAAAVLVSVSALSYLAYPLLFKKDRREPAVVTTPPGPVPPKDRARRDKDSPPDRRGNHELVEGPRKDSSPVSPVHKDGNADGSKPANDSRASVGKPKQESNSDPVNTAPKGEPDRLRIQTPNLSVLAELRDLEQQETRDRLLAKVQGADAHHVRLLCRETGQTLKLLRGVLAAKGITLVVDREVQNRLNKRRAKPNLALYAENLKPDEVVAIFHQLARAEQKAAAADKAPPPSGLLLVTAMTVKLRQQVAKLLPAGTTPPPKPPAAQSRRSVLVVPFFEEDAPFPPRAAHSREVKQYRSGRTKPQVGTVQVVLELLRDNAS
jgi:hypothetical protein